MYLSRIRGLGASQLAATIASAITRQENTNPSYNNPCGLVSGPGQTGTAGNGIAIFSDSSTGLTDCQNDIDNYIGQGMTLSQLISTWAPAPSASCGAMCAGNNPTQYAANVSSWTGIDPNTPLNTLDAASSSSGFDLSDLSNLDLSSVGGIDLSQVDWSTLVPVLVILGLTALVVFRK